VESANSGVVREPPAQLAKKGYLPDWMSFAPVELDYVTPGEVQWTRGRVVGFWQLKTGIRLRHFWNPEFTINKHFLTCDEKYRIKGEISS
jgi:hypothetical protein